MADHQCVLCSDFVTSEHKLMKRHVAITHGQSTYSTLQCGICTQKYYDFDHIQDHIQETPSCKSDCLKVTPVPLADHVEKAFISLVNQMMIPVHIQPAHPSNSTAAELTIGEIGSQSKIQLQLSQSNSQNSCKKSLAEVKMECTDTEGDSESQETISATSMANETTTMQDLHPDKQMDVHIQDEENAMEEDGLDASLNRGHGSIEGHVHTVEGAINQLSIIEESGQKQTRCKPNVDDLRLECRCIISKRSHEGRLTCSLCNASISVSNSDGKNRNTSNVLSHIRGHLGTPLFCCQLCTIKSKHYANIRQHLANAHNATFDQCVDKIGDHVETFMRMIHQCFDHSKRRGSTAIGHRLAQKIKIDQGSLPEDGGCTSISDGHETEEIAHAQSSIVKQNNDQEQRRNPNESDLRLHCRQIIVKRQHKNPMTCAIRKASIAVVAQGVPNHYSTLRHVQRHANPPLFQCKSCHLKSNDRLAIRQHVAGKHSASGQYIDTAADRIDELIQLVTQCFDHGFQTTKSKVAHRISGRLQDIGTSGQEIGTDQATPNEDHDSETQNPPVPTVAGVFKQRTNLPKVTDCQGSKGINQLFTRNQPRKPRYTVGCKKQGEFPVTLEKNYLGTWYGAARVSKLSKDVKKSMSNGPSASNKDSTMRRLVLPMDILAQKRLCSMKAKKFVKNGKLKCKLCQQQITISNNNSNFGRIHKAYFHATAHVHDVDVFECTMCNYRTSNQAVMYNHVARKHNPDQRKFIDHRAKYYPKILQMFLACFTNEKPVASEIGKEGHQDEKMESACSSLEPMDSTRDKDTKSVCVKCGYKTANQMLFRMHQKIMHAE